MCLSSFAGYPLYQEHRKYFKGYSFLVLALVKAMKAIRSNIIRAIDAPERFSLSELEVVWYHLIFLQRIVVAIIAIEFCDAGILNGM
jgi:hypothetical protein